MAQNGSLVEQVAQMLRKGIPRGRFGKEKLPDERKLADDLGVSRGTLRKALGIIEEEGLVARIRSKGTLILGHEKNGPALVVKRLGILYRYAMEFIDQGTISGSPFYAKIFSGAVARASKRGYDLLVLATERDQVAEGLIHRIEDVAVGGLLLIAETDEEQLARLNSLNLPMILVDHKTDIIDVDSINPDSFGGAVRAVEYLTKLGHKRIGYINWWKGHLNMDRLNGFRAGLRKAGLPCKEDYLEPGSADNAGGRDAMKRILKLDHHPTAMLTFCDGMAMGAMQAIREAGLSVPGDISIFGCGNDPGSEEAGLTTLAWDERGLGSLAVERLITRIQAPKLKIEDLTGGFSLIERASCAAPRNAHAPMKQPR